tara:strand:+ start:69 stop:242 length:174 start_codon:yes stop_codon:yes gene_type:complete
LTCFTQSPAGAVYLAPRAQHLQPYFKVYLEGIGQKPYKLTPIENLVFALHHSAHIDQ